MRVALVTGASRGIGAATARAFAQAGAAVALAARDADALAALAREIEAAGGRALAVPTDVGDPAAVARLVERTVATYGRLDAAFNNAGGGPRPAPLHELSPDDFDLAIRVNLRGTFLAMKYEIPALLAAGGGAIVNMSSTAGLHGVRGIAGYVAAKHGVIGLTKTAALEYGARGLRVNVVAPGPILTDRLAALDEQARARAARAEPRVIQHRLPQRASRLPRRALESGAADSPPRAGMVRLSRLLPLVDEVVSPIPLRSQGHAVRADGSDGPRSSRGATGPWSRLSAQPRYEGNPGASIAVKRSGLATPCDFIHVSACATRSTPSAPPISWPQRRRAAAR